MDKLHKFLQKNVEHNEKYRNLPLEQIPNFYLKRPLTKHEMNVLQLIALCETDNEEQYKNWLRSMVLSGHIKNFLKEAREAEKRGYWERKKRILHETGIFELTLDKPVPFPPQRREH